MENCFSCYNCVSFPATNEKLIMRGFPRSCLSVSICRNSGKPWYIALAATFILNLVGAAWFFGASFNVISNFQRRFVFSFVLRRKLR